MISNAVIFVGFVVALVVVGVLAGLLYVAKKAANESVAESVYRPTVQPQQPARSEAAPVPAVQIGISGEIVAAISAAVAAIMDEQAPGTTYAIASIQSAKTSRPAWGFAAMQQNTRPF